MKVILLRDVARIGRKHEIADVADGFAQNSLFPRGLAQPATPGNLERIAALRKKDVAAREGAEAALSALRESLAGEPLSLSLPANAQGHLFQAVRPSDLAALLTTRGFAADAKDVVVDKPIKDVGAHAFTVSHHGATAKLSVIITAQT